MQNIQGYNEERGIKAAHAHLLQPCPYEAERQGKISQGAAGLQGKEGKKALRALRINPAARCPEDRLKCSPCFS